MIPRKIDLTENMDFSGGNQVTFRNISRSRLQELDLMSTDEYEEYVLWTGIFGKRRHKNMKDEIFGHWGTPYGGEDPGICPRCGKPTPIPWKKFWNGLCRECFEFVNGNPIPWDIPQKTAVRNTVGEVFDLR